MIVHRLIESSSSNKYCVGLIRSTTWYQKMALKSLLQVCLLLGITVLVKSQAGNDGGKIIVLKGTSLI